MNATDLRVKLALVQSEFDHLIYRKHRLDERLDRLAKEMETIRIEVAAQTLKHDATDQFKPRPVRMEIV